MRYLRDDLRVVRVQLIWSAEVSPLLIALLPLYLYALAEGDKTDLACIYVLAFGALFSFALGLYAGKPAQTWPYSASQLGIDALLLTAQILIALRAPRYYPILMAAAQLLVVIAGALSVARLVGQPKTLMVVFAGAATIQFAAFACGLAARRRPDGTATSATISAG